MADETPNLVQSTVPRPDARFEEAIEQVRQALAGLCFGEVSVIVQDGVVVQLERRERKRLRSNSQRSGRSPGENLR